MNIVGHEELKDHLNAIKDKADAYKKCGVSVPNFIMNISRGNGQSVVAEYITNFYSENELRPFYALDEMKEYRLDGSLRQVKHIISDINCNAVYTNEFEGVVVIDFSALAAYINEYQVEYFINEIDVVARNATLIFLYDDSLGNSIMLIKDRIISQIGNCIDIPVLPYTIEEYVEIIVENIKKRGIDIELGKDMKTFLSKIVDSNKVSTAKQAVAIAEKLILLADYSSFIPRIDLKTLAKHYASDLRVV